MSHGLHVRDIMRDAVDGGRPAGGDNQPGTFRIGTSVYSAVESIKARTDNQP